MANWTDSLPRRDFYNLPSNNNNSLPRRDRAGLGRPEPSGRNPIGGSGFESSTENVTNTFGTSLMPRRRDSSLNRDNPFRDALQAKGDLRVEKKIFLCIHDKPFFIVRQTQLNWELVLRRCQRQQFRQCKSWISRCKWAFGWNFQYFWTFTTN